MRLLTILHRLGAISFVHTYIYIYIYMYVCMYIRLLNFHEQGKWAMQALLYSFVVLFQILREFIVVGAKFLVF